ncbi:MAG: TauD/TfdA family dioxygenase [Alphaproteobacteria bacterium]|nr:TauD/TfdA family dioxygenase [Alphaproteobacteria bacterium]
MSEVEQTVVDDASYETIEVRPVAGALGAEIHGVDLSQPLGNQTWNEIHRAWLQHNVVFFRDQTLTPQQYLAFAKRWGGIHLHPYMKGLEDIPEIFEIIKKEDDTQNFGGRWHTDQMFCPEPAKATMLYALEVPTAGGDTMFSNLYRAYDSLSDGMKAMLADMKTFNVGDRKYGGLSRAERYAKGGSMAGKVAPPKEDINSEHPLIRTHPETGRKALYIGSHTERFAGMTKEESQPLMDYLMEQAHRPEVTCRFRWEVGSLAIWDNRCCQHNAVNDYHGQRRRMHRITIKGDRPF